MRVTIAICTWNRCNLLRRTLERMAQLVIPEGVQWEILVINNNSTDATDAVVDSFIGRLPVRRLTETRLGQSHARNLAIESSASDVIAWTDDDVLVDARWIAELLFAFGRQKADWVFGRSEPEWPSHAPDWYAPRLKNLFAVIDYGPRAFIVQDRDHPFFGLNFAGTRDAHVALGGFRSEFGLRGQGGGIGEDIDMFERALAAGMKIAYAPDALVHHVIPPERVEKRYHRRRLWVSNGVFYRHLDEMFGNVPWLLGLPRFFYPDAVRNAAGYLRCLAARDRAQRFQHELNLLRFVRIASESARHGFRRPSPAVSSHTKPSRTSDTVGS